MMNPHQIKALSESADGAVEAWDKAIEDADEKYRGMMVSRK